MSTDIPNNPDTALSTSGICFSFGKKQVLDHVDIEVPKGKFVALLGANGAGKSTLFSIITGLYGATEGSVHIGGYDLRRNTQDALGRIGVVFQRPTLDRDLSVLQNLRYFCQLQGIARAEASVRIDAALSAHGLAEMKKSRITELSGGQQRRVELARSLLHKPELLLLDEPTVGLDYRNRIDFVSNVKGLCSSFGAGVLWATHLMDEVEDADYVYIMHRGKVVSSGAVTDLREIYQQDSIADLFRHLTGQAEDDDKARERSANSIVSGADNGASA